MDARKARKIAAVEEEFGMSFIDVLKDYAEDHSYSFTMQSLGLNKDTFKDFKKLFTERKQPKQTRPHITKRNLDNAPEHDGYKVRELMEITGLGRSTIQWRINNGWSIEKIKKTPAKNRGNVENFKGRRNNSTWAEKIHKECEVARSHQTA